MNWRVRAMGISAGVLAGSADNLGPDCDGQGGQNARGATQ